MISGLLVLFERAFVLFVENDEPKTRTRRENGTSRTDDHRDFALHDSFPMPKPLGIAKVTVQNGDTPESRHESLARLGSEANFRHEDDRLASVLQRLGNRLH